MNDNELDQQVYILVFSMEKPYDDEFYSQKDLEENFPNCCPYHISMVKHINSWWSTYPANELDKKLTKLANFSKDAYNYIPEKVLNQTMYFLKHVELKLNDENWLNEIKDYLLYAIKSFGGTFIGADQFLFIISQEVSKYIIKYESHESNFKLKKIHNIIMNFMNIQFTNETDPEELVKLLLIWFDIVPNMEPFNSIKKDIDNKTIFSFIVKGKYYNKYLDKHLNITKSKDELNHELMELTVSALNSIDSSWFIKNKRIKEFHEFKIAVINENHRILQTKLLNEFSKSQSKYIDLIENWLKNEQLYFDKISPMLNSIMAGTSNNKIEKAQWLKLKSNVNFESLKDLHSGLEKLGCININYMNFKKLFNGNPPESKISWDGVGDLASFIKELELQKKIYKLSYKWKTTLTTFCDKNGNDFNPDQLRNAQQTNNFETIKKLVGYL